MTKEPAPVARLNRLLARLVKTKDSQIAVAKALDISSQSLGYYIRGRKIPASIIEKWQQVYGQNLLEMSKMNFEEDFETLVSKNTQAGTSGFQRAVESEALAAELLKELQKNNRLFERELERAWALIDRLSMNPETRVKRIKSKE